MEVVGLAALGVDRQVVQAPGPVAQEPPVFGSEISGNALGRPMITGWLIG